MAEYDKVNRCNKFWAAIGMDNPEPKGRIFGGDGKVDGEFQIYAGDMPLDINGAPIKDRNVKRLLLDGRY